MRAHLFMGVRFPRTLLLRPIGFGDLLAMRSGRFPPPSHRAPTQAVSQSVSQSD